MSALPTREDLLAILGEMVEATTAKAGGMIQMSDTKKRVEFYSRLRPIREKARAMLVTAALVDTEFTPGDASSLTPDESYSICHALGHNMVATAFSDHEYRIQWLRDNRREVFPPELQDPEACKPD